MFWISPFIHAGEIKLPHEGVEIVSDGSVAVRVTKFNEAPHGLLDASGVSLGMEIGDREIELLKGAHRCPYRIVIGFLYFSERIFSGVEVGQAIAIIVQNFFLFALHPDGSARFEPSPK